MPAQRCWAPSIGTGVKIGANAVVVKDVPGTWLIGAHAYSPKPEKDTARQVISSSTLTTFEEPALYI